MVQVLPKILDSHSEGDWPVVATMYAVQAPITIILDREIRIVFDEDTVTVRWSLVLLVNVDVLSL